MRIGKKMNSMNRLARAGAAAASALILGGSGYPAVGGEGRSPVTDLQVPAGLIDNLNASNPNEFEQFATGAARPLGTPSPEITVRQPACDTRIIMTVFSRAGRIAHHGDFATSGGTLLAKIQNTSTSCNFELIGLAHGHTAYWVVDLDAYSLYRSRFVDVSGFDTEIGKNSGLKFQECPQHHPNTAEGAMVQERQDICSHYFVRAAPGSTATDPSLAQAEFVNFKSTIGAARGKGHPFTGGGDDPTDPLLWFTCAGGCCYADF
jgi:hypothetical protein